MSEESVIETLRMIGERAVEMGEKLLVERDEARTQLAELRDALTKCRFRDCKEQATTTVTIRLPKQWDEFTVVAEEARDQPLEVCDHHARALAASGILT